MTDEQTPLSAYRALRFEGELHHDSIQELAVEKLQLLHGRLKYYNPVSSTKWTDIFRLGPRKPREEPPQGIYMYGDVGRGKSMLMDLFFDTAPVSHKRRVHFHAFMLDVHAFIHNWRQQEVKDGDDPLVPLAQKVAEDAWLLCFDEFQVTDVADAMLLSRLFELLFSHGVVVIATSNRIPEDLYKDGLNRELFLPFIQLIKDQMDILHLSGGTDYRLERLSRNPVYFSPLDSSADQDLSRIFNELTEGAEIEPLTLKTQGRELEVLATARGVARFTFDVLCAQPLGAADYLTLTEHFHSLIISDVPKLGAENRNEAKRFVTLVDILYENHTNLVLSAEVPADQLYEKGDGHFEFARTVSRLMEMRSEEYLRRAST
jgi:cell division protein ZapE